MTLLSAIVGYLIGSIPSAAWIANMRGIDLRSEGSGNPGANNARKVGGMGLAAVVLAVEIFKGFAAAEIGSMIGGDWGAVAAGLSAIAGNVYNVWYRFQGGKGLGITAGVLIATWPLATIVLIALIALGAILTRSSGMATLIALAGSIVAAFLWWFAQWGNAWGVDTSLLPGMAIGMSLLIFPKHLVDARSHRLMAGA